MILLSLQRIYAAANAAFHSQSALEEVAPGERLERETESAEQEAAALLIPALPLLFSQAVQLGVGFPASWLTGVLRGKYESSVAVQLPRRGTRACQLSHQSPEIQEQPSR